MNAIYADSATATLAKLAERAYEPMARLVARYVAAHNGLMQTDDVLEAMQGTLSMILAAEALSDQLDLATKAMREELAQQMEDTGCPGVAASGATAITARKPMLVTVHTPAVVPPSYWVTPEPRINREALRSALKTGQVPGAVLEAQAGVVLRIKTGAGV